MNPWRGKKNRTLDWVSWVGEGGHAFKIKNLEADKEMRYNKNFSALDFFFDFDFDF